MTSRIPALLANLIALSFILSHQKFGVCSLVYFSVWVPEYLARDTGLFEYSECGRFFHTQMRDYVRRPPSMCIVRFRFCRHFLNLFVESTRLYRLRS